MKVPGIPTASFLLSLTLATPILVIAASVFLSTGDLWGHLWETVLPRYFKNTGIILAGVGIGVLIVGVSTAWIVTMYRFRGRWVLEWALMLPLAMPTYLMAYTYTDFLDFSGPVQTWIRTTFDLGFGEYWFPEIRSVGGAVFAFIFVLYPYVYLLARASFIEQSVCVLEAAQTLRRSPWQSFREVALPLGRPAIAAGTTLALMEALAEYGAVDYFAVDTFTTGIYRTWFGLGSPIGAAQLSALLLGIVVVLIVLERVSRGKRKFAHSTNRYRSLPRWELRGWKNVLAVAYCAVPILIGFAIPAGILLRFAFQHGSQQRLQAVSDLALHSFSLAAVTAILAVGISALIAYSLRNRPHWTGMLAARVASLGYTIPGSVIAIGVLLSFGWVDGRINQISETLFNTSPGLVLGGTVVGLVFAYLVRFMAVSLNSVEAGLSKIHPHMDQAGRLLGSNSFGILARIHAPIMKGSLLTAGLLVFVDVLKELPATLIIRPFNFDTLAIRVHHLASDERLGEAALPALTIVAVGLIPVILLSYLISRARPGS